MNRVVIFTKNNARVVYNPENIEELKKSSSILINPDLSSVHGYAPHYWKLVNKQIVPMTVDEMNVRLRDHDINGVDNTVPETISISAQLPKVAVNWVVLSLVISSIANIILVYLVLSK